MSDRIVNLFGDNARAPAPQPRIDLANEAPIELGAVTVEPSLRRVTGPSGEAMLEPKVMQVLVALARNPGEVHSRDDLIASCWDGRIVGDASINRVISLLRTALRDVGGDAVTVNTTPRVGYRLLVNEPRAVPPSPAGTAEEHEPGAATRKRAFPVLPAVFASIMAAIAAIGALWFWQGQSTPIERVTIAMVPIDVSGSDEDTLFARGLESELREELGRSEYVEVTTSVTARDMAANEADASAIGKALGAQYIMRGTLSRPEGRVALDLEMIDAASGAVVWDDTFISSDENSMRLPIRAARASLQAIDKPVAESADASGLTTDDFKLYLTARGLIRTRDPQSGLAAIDILRPLSARYPRFAGVQAALAKALLLAANAQVLDAGDANREALALAKEAHALDPGSVEALKALGLASDTADMRVRYLREAVERDPGDSEAWLWYAQVTAHPDYPGEELRASIKTAELDPLWGRSWQASWSAAAESGPALAKKVERELIAASPEQWQADAARGRLAAIDGDLSEMHRLTMQSVPFMAPGQRQIAMQQLGNIFLLLEMPFPGMQQPGGAGIVASVIAGDLPSKQDLVANGMWGRDFWLVGPLTIAGPRHFIAEGRSDELLEIYDASFDGPEDLARFAASNLREHHYIANIATYVGFAMQQAGRRQEAEELFDLAEKSVARWRVKDAMTMTPSIFEANLAAAQGQNSRAVAAIERAKKFGWPYVLQSPGTPWTGPLLDDPVWRGVRGDPALAKAMRPIRERLARERREVMAQSGGANGS